MGQPAVQYLVWTAVNGKDWGVRQASINALGNVGAGARSSCPQLQGIARTNPYGGGVVSSKEDMENEVKYEDLRRAAKGAMARIGC